jgi:hypothetical protein
MSAAADAPRRLEKATTRSVAPYLELGRLGSIDLGIVIAGVTI